MGGSSEGAKRFAERMLQKDPEYFSKLNKKSREAWKANGQKPQGFKKMSLEERREVSLKGVTARRAKR